MHVVMAGLPQLQERGDLETVWSEQALRLLLSSLQPPCSDTRRASAQMCWLSC